ncbi:PPR domain-containing protein/PPR_2 domain-containing protein, partial [Cephalotus follicularis]
LLKACASLSNFHYGQTLHSTIIVLGLQFDPFITTSLINMYVKCGSLGDAAQVFDQLFWSEALVQDVTIWNSIIYGFFKCSHFKDGVVQFRRMLLMGIRPDAYSLCILLGRCGDGIDGKQIHGHIVRNVFNVDPYLETALIDMYCCCDRPMDAWRLLDKLEDKHNVVAWNVMIGGFCENGLWVYSLELYTLAKNEDVEFVSSSFSSTLSACYQGEAVGFGAMVHCDVIKMGFGDDPYVYTSLLTMYAKCRLVEDAERVFDQIPHKVIELWNAMISAYVGNGFAYEALDVYRRMRLSKIPPDCFTMSNILSCSSMIGSYGFGRSLHAELVKREMEAEGVKPDSDIMASVISASTGLENVYLGCQIHGSVTKSGFEMDVFVASSLIDMYSKCGFPEMAGNVFSGMQHKNLVAWNSILSCYCRNGLPELSIGLFPQIVQQGLYPDSVSITSVLVAVSSIAALLKGKILHGYLLRLKILSDIQVENALIDMYVKCGLLKYAERIFQNMGQKNLVSWNSMISGYGSHGDCLGAMGLFDEMKRSGIASDEVTFLSLFSSCNHSGFVKEGQNLFQSMRVEYGIEPNMDHYVNIVDLLGRAGCLDDAYSFVRNMPIEPDRSVWLCLLCACRAYHNVGLGEVVAHKLVNLEPSRGSNYVQLMNLYGEAEMWDNAANIRALMKERQLKKSPGCSWIEVRNRVDAFYSGDSSSLRTTDIYETLSTLRRNMKK